MKILLSLNCFLLISIWSIGQETNDWSISGVSGNVFFKPSITINQIGQKENQKFSPNIAFNIGKKINRNLFVEIGLRYSIVSFEFRSNRFVTFEEQYTINSNNEKLTQSRPYLFNNSFGEIIVEAEIDYFMEVDLVSPQDGDNHKLLFYSTNNINQLGIPIG